MDAVQIFFLDFLLFRLVHGGELCNNVHDLLRSAEDIGNILKQIVGHKSAIHNFCGANLSRNRKYLFGIQLHHLAVFIFTDDREEVQQFLDVFLRVSVSPRPSEVLEYRSLANSSKIIRVRAGSKSKM